MPTLLMVPGLLCDGDLFPEQVRALAGVVDVVVPDVTVGASVAAMADAALAAAPPGRFALAGLSMGGYVAWEIMRRAGDRVTHLALLDTSARPDSPEQTAARHALLALSEQGRFDEVLERVWPRMVAEAHLDDADLRARHDAMSLRQGPEVLARQLAGIIARPDSRPDLAGVTVPTLVLCGREDAITPVDAHQEMAAGIPGADLVVLGGAGHLTTWERPDAVAAALRGLLAR